MVAKSPGPDPSHLGTNPGIATHILSDPGPASLSVKMMTFYPFKHPVLCAYYGLQALLSI